MSQMTARGLFFVGFGALGVLLGSDMEIGTAAEMGVGYVPRALAIGCIAVGVSTLAAAWLGKGAVSESRIPLAAKPLAIVTALVVAFGLLLPWLGLPLTIIVVVLAAGVSGEAFRGTLLIATALIVAIVSTLLFHNLLNLQIPVWPALKGIV